MLIDPDKMFLKSIFPALLWAIFILIICGIPGQNLPRLDLWSWLKPDKLVHLFVFGLLSFLLIKGFMKQQAVRSLRSHPNSWAILLTIGYGAMIELLQEFLFINRTGDLRDAIADAIGAFAGWWCFHYLLKKRLSHKSHSS